MKYNNSLKEIFGFLVADIRVVEDIISFCEFHKFEMQFGIEGPCAVELFNNRYKR